MIYAARFETMNALLAYLTENCCKGAPESCGPAVCSPGVAAKPKEGDGVKRLHLHVVVQSLPDAIRFLFRRVRRPMPCCGGLAATPIGAIDRPALESGGLRRQPAGADLRISASKLTSPARTDPRSTARCTALATVGSSAVGSVGEKAIPVRKEF